MKLGLIRALWACCALLPVWAAAAEVAELPPAVAAYYDDMRLVARFSLPEERVQLMTGRRPPTQTSPRLQEVDAALKRLVAYKTTDYGVRTPTRVAEGRERWPDFRTMPAFDVRSVKMKEDSLDVEIKAFSDTAREKLRVLTAWDATGKRPDPIIAAMDKTRMAHAAPREVHTWHLRDGEWVREPASWALSRP